MNRAQVSSETLYSGGMAWWDANRPTFSLGESFIPQPARRNHGPQPGGTKARVLKLVANTDHPVDVAELRTHFPRAFRKRIMTALSELYAAGTIVRSGIAGQYRYRMP